MRLSFDLFIGDCGKGGGREVSVLSLLRPLKAFVDVAPEMAPVQRVMLSRCIRCHEVIQDSSDL